MSPRTPAAALTADEAAFVEAFRAGTLDADSFHHREHVRMAWLYVRLFGFEDALARFTADLRAFTAAHGVPQLFHATITVAYLSILAERLAQTPDHPWEAFAAAHPDVLAWKPSILDRYYTVERLWSDDARARFLMPDRVRPADAG